MCNIAARESRMEAKAQKSRHYSNNYYFQLPVPSPNGSSRRDLCPLKHGSETYSGENNALPENFPLSQRQQQGQKKKKAFTINNRGLWREGGRRRRAVGNNAELMKKITCFHNVSCFHLRQSQPRVEVGGAQHQVT